ncbi:MAG: hypothetical protein ACLSAP_04825 [Oscillospiraceae bacterium]
MATSTGNGGFRERRGSISSNGKTERYIIEIVDIEQEMQADEAELAGLLPHARALIAVPKEERAEKEAERLAAEADSLRRKVEDIEQRAKELEKKWQLAGNADAIKFNVLYQELQRVHMALCDIIDACRDTQQRAKLRQAMHAVLTT